MKMGADRHYVNTARKGVVTMTENEAIEALRLINTSRVHPFYSWEEMAEVRDIAISALEEIQQYRKIGTVEECREAVEKQEPKKPEVSDSDFDYYKCPVCGAYIWATDCVQDHNYCLNCGQAIDWEESEE